MSANRTQISRIESLMQRIKKSPLGQQLIPMEAAVGWPIPLRKGDSVYARIPLYGVRSDPSGGADLFPMISMVTIEWTSGKPVEYIDFSFSAPWTFEVPSEGAIGRFPHPAVEVTGREYIALKSELMSMYDELLENLSSREPISSEWAARFGELLGTLLEPSLEPYYRALSPKFFDRFVPRD